MREGRNEDGYFRTDCAFFCPERLYLAGIPACADSGSDYKAGSDFAKQVQGNGLNSLKNFSGEQNLPGYTDNPDQTKYYGGVTASGDSSLKSDSAPSSAGRYRQNDYGVVHEPATGSDISGCAVYSGRKGYRIPCRQHCR